MVFGATAGVSTIMWIQGGEVGNHHSSRWGDTTGREEDKKEILWMLEVLHLKNEGKL